MADASSAYYSTGGISVPQYSGGHDGSGPFSHPKGRAVDPVFATADPAGSTVLHTVHYGGGQPMDFRQSISLAVQQSADFCAAGCCGRVCGFVAIYVVLIGGLCLAVLKGPWDTGGIAQVLLFLLLAAGPPALFLLFISRTFGHAIDRCQVALTFFTAGLLMVPLIVIISVLPFTGLYRALYRLDPVRLLSRATRVPACPGLSRALSNS